MQLTHTTTDLTDTHDDQFLSKQQNCLLDKPITCLNQHDETADIEHSKLFQEFRSVIFR